MKLGGAGNQRHLARRVFDEYGRLTSSTDRNGVTTTISSYDFLDRVLERRMIGALGANQTGLETFEYDARGLINATNALGKVTSFVRDELGRTLFQTNANFELLQFNYNAADQLLTLTDGNTNTTRWNYDAEGRVTNKVDAANADMFRYVYDANGRQTNRWQAGNISTTFRYDAVGNLTNIVYPSSSNVVLRYDALNRLTNMTDGIGSTAFGWTAGNQLASEDGPWANDTVSYTTVNRLRTAMSVLTSSSSLLTSYSYDEYWRMTNVTSVAGSFTTLYKDVTAGSTPMAADLVAELDLPGGSAITNEFDDLARMLSTVLGNSQLSTLNVHQYQYNEGNQRTNQTFMAGNYMSYAYDDIGQLKTAKGWESDTITPRQHEQFGFAYDKGWNLNRRTNNALVQTFGVNNLNELTNATRTGNMTVVGNTTTAATSVTLNNSIAELYGDNAFARTNVSLVNGTNTFTAIAENATGLKDTNIITAYLPTPVTYYYDARGNLTNDGRRVFYYDDENQLTSVTVSNAWRSEFAYDGMMRRRIRKEYTWQSSAWLKTNEVRYVYDGRLVIQERDTNNLTLVTYTRGNDLSGTREGAGGIGGLLARTANLPQLTPSVWSAFYHADGNGNITAMVNPSGNRVAQYHYDPYGNLLDMNGPLAEANLIRFSSKEHHANSGLVYYLYRYYDSNLQRWVNRDPIEESGGRNLYEFVGSQPVSKFDPLGWAENDPPGSVSGPGSACTTSPLLPRPGGGNYLPPGVTPESTRGFDKRGSYVQDPSGKKYYPHPEDKGHWPHYDTEDKDGKKGRYPEKPVKPWPNQKKPPYGDQNDENPWDEIDKKAQEEKERREKEQKEKEMQREMIRKIMKETPIIIPMPIPCRLPILVPA